MKEPEPPWYERHPQIFAYVAAPIVLVLLGVALNAWLRARSMLDVREADNERALAYVALGFAALSAVMGSVGYILRNERRKVARDVAAHTLSRDIIVAALERPPLVFCASFRRQLNIALGIVVALGLIGLVTFAVAVAFAARDAMLAHDPLLHAIATHRAMGQFGLIFALLGGGAAAWVRVRERRRASVLAAPKLEWMTLVERIELRTNLAVTGYTYGVRSAQGRKYSITTPHKLPPVVDERSNVLVVMPRHDPDALPFVVHCDGYPFEIRPPTT